MTGYVDAHVHFWDAGELRYHWLVDDPAWQRNVTLEDYRSATIDDPPDRFVYVQVGSEPPDPVAEATWVQEMCAGERNFGGMVVWAPVAGGADAVAEHLDRFEVVPFEGYTLTLRELARLVATATGQPQHIRRFPWIALRLASPFWRMGRHLVEMSYLWSKPHRLDNQRFRELLPEFRPTAPLIAIASVFQDQIHPDKPMAGSLSHVAAE